MSSKTRINLALQGGGAHGAFTWGVLDRLLQEEDIEIAAISGTSAGAMNGAALKAGLISGGRGGARENLAWLWQQMGAVEDTRFSNWMTALSPFPSMFSAFFEHSIPFQVAEAATNFLSPYDYGPAYFNPLERIAERFHYDLVCMDCEPELFISATNVRSGKLKVFSGEQISAQAILASTCLPTLFQAVEIEDPDTGTTEAYWDGGYIGNPALFPLVEKNLPGDVVIVNINPLFREELPRTASEIQNRINEISFNSSLLRELRALTFTQQLVSTGLLQKKKMKDLHIHMIADNDLMNELSVATKMIPNPATLTRLFEAGVAAAEGFLARDRANLGVRDSVDLAAMFKG
ncbi:patatin-like phospholipase family protein [Pseudoruegeria sp. SHC-113]|uniref:patatin-like phospholipase family protein n=1 Tax=Pseudoruegeria sp. SHC-113 TaxID=2855439 RepID=UPI0021BACF67|nr:patatin-like phospholipase family protein [Pseudoruegeria sp. SHC-113]MCT8160454.1 patatin-like phospholipase family protein [Pseudoruegeria sp. SHC-113]